MPFSPELAAIRFGCGLSPEIAPPASAEALLEGLSGPDRMASDFPIEGFAEFRVWLTEASALAREVRRNRGDKDKLDRFQKMKREAVAEGVRWAGNALLRWTWSPAPFRERLTAFWADHFTAYGKNGILLAATAPYVEEAIRPRIGGRFADMLIAVVTHPLMLHYLDQNASVGPHSKLAASDQKARLRGLNENLAREVMELHTLGVGGPYTQEDVRQMAELLTGLNFNFKDGFRFRPRLAEPGAETVLGRSYGGDPARLEPVLRALSDLATHPATGAHIARKLAVHFVADDPPKELVGHLSARFAETGGDLAAVYAALLEHPAAWALPLRNVKPPVDFIASTWRALAVRADHIQAMPLRDMRQGLLRPLKVMGQPWQRPNGPDGWPEDDAAWITPQGVSARLRWALAAPALLRPDLPDPRQFVETALGPFADDKVRFAARAAENQAQGIGLVLAAPAFQRR